ncbi:aldehyde dehydrogenase (NADP(+)) [Pantoea sp. Tr-811]|uniref:aldehyde dehydrogenase (NADP(+)) n=1 Tax=Pantoea sp. Tr-811 TaxID=2608361 RepID=UPI001422D4E3|nr:aldehyde dehydrogenase (NADP(+)) [Pantoea sp. Tr-811]NIF30301.1 aldehyde dehydrogenase (NADP(+)) [Pantoea sp. Tr-811]
MSNVRGESFIGLTSTKGRGNPVLAKQAATGEPFGPAFGSNTLDDLERACALADGCFDSFRNLPEARRASWLEAIGQGLLDLGDVLIERAHLETGLPRPRLEGERLRTVKQLQLFATLLREDGASAVVIEPGEQGVRSDLRLRRVPVGPVAVFGASNFPLAFSVAGGDTASALAAGCPVVVKAHPAHLGTSELVARIVVEAAKATEMPDGVFSMLIDPDFSLGQALVGHPVIQAVGFTGSRHGGLALLQIAQSRPAPIPVYAEMSSINPLIILPAALQSRAEDIAEKYVASLTMGSGQFCTNPGLVIVVNGEGLDQFTAKVGQSLAVATPATMLTPGIHAAYCKGLETLQRTGHVRLVGEANKPVEKFAAQAAVFTTQAEAFTSVPELHAENFGPSSIVVVCESLAQVQGVLKSLDGQLTATVHADEADHDAAYEVLPLLERLAGRILFNGFPTGVEVSKAMVHGGPFPSTSDAKTTSVGTLAIERFLRPVCYQDIPLSLLPAVLKPTA